MAADPLPPPKTIHELRARCRDWPEHTVRLAVHTILGETTASAEECDVLAALITEWLIGTDDSEPPPLNPAFILLIWAMLQELHQ